MKIKIGDRVQILSSLVSVPIFGKVLFIDETLERITVLVDGYAASNSFRVDELKPIGGMMSERLTPDMLPKDLQPLIEDKILTCRDCRYHPSLGPLWFRCGFDNKHTHPDTKACKHIEATSRLLVDELADAVRWLTGAAWHSYEWGPSQARLQENEHRCFRIIRRIQARYREKSTNLQSGQVNL